MPSKEFADIARKWAPFIRHSNKIAFAVRTQERWVLQYSFTAFSPFKINVVENLVRTPSVFFARKASIVPQSRAEKTLADVLSDTAMISIAGENFELPGKGYGIAENYNPMYLPRFPGPQRLPAIESTRNGIETFNYPRLDMLELELKGGTVPYDGFNELFADVGLPFLAQTLGGWNSQYTEITIAPPAFVESIELKGGNLKFSIQASELINKEKIQIRLKLIPEKQGQIERLEFSGEVTWEVKNDVLVGQFSMATPKIGLLQVFLSYDEEFLGSWWVRDAALSFSQRSTLHKAIDSKGAFSQKFFDDRKTFEERTTVLLSLLNLDCLFYGAIAELKDAPDILALSSQGHLYVVECTTGDINSHGKLRRLYERTNEIRGQLENSSFKPREILSVMIASVPQSETLYCTSELENYGIALLAREGIEQLLRQIDAPPSADVLFSTIVGTIPRTLPSLDTDIGGQIHAAGA